MSYFMMAVLGFIGLVYVAYGVWAVLRVPFAGLVWCFRKVYGWLPGEESVAKEGVRR